jgi:hypothetical protein
MIPVELRRSLDPAQIYHELLEHRWYMSEDAGHDVGLEEAVASYIENVLPNVPDPTALRPEEPDEADGIEEPGEPGGE